MKGIIEDVHTDTQVILTSYRYFPIAKFLWGPSRMRKVEWFRDEYTQAVARFPVDARFSFAAHSNGTFIIANVLREYSAIRFDRGYFAGSVVPEDFDWKRIINNGQLGLLRNDCCASE